MQPQSAGKFIDKPLVANGNNTERQLPGQAIQSQFMQQTTRNVIIVYGKSQLQMKLPVRWTINKVKCMLASHFSMLDFDKFEFECERFLIPGRTTVANLKSSRLTVTQADCPGAFNKYYRQTMKNVLSEHNICPESELMPVFHRSLAPPLSCNVPKARQANLQKLGKDVRQNGQNNVQVGIGFFNVLRFFGFVLLFNMITTMADYTQIGILVVVALLYMLIEQHVNDNNNRQRRRVRRQEREGRQNINGDRNENENGVRQEQAQEEQDNENGRQPQQKQLEANGQVQVQGQRQMIFKEEQQKTDKKHQKINKQQQQQDPFQQQFDVSNYSQDQRRTLERYQHIRLKNDQKAASQILKYWAQQFQDLDERQFLIKQTVIVSYMAFLKRNQNYRLKKQQYSQRSRRLRSIQAKFILWGAFLTEITYCYVLSMFPNWTVQTHLHANQQRINQVLDQVKELDSDVSELVKNWKKQKKSPQQKKKTQVNAEAKTEEKIETKVGLVEQSQQKIFVNKQEQSEEEDYK